MKGECKPIRLVETRLTHVMGPLVQISPGKGLTGNAEAFHGFTHSIEGNAGQA